MNRKVHQKTKNGSKVCAYGNCRSNGATLPKDTDVSFFPFAKPCMMYRNEEIEFCLKKKTGQREHKTLECSQCSRAMRWITLTGRKDHRLQGLIDITKDMYVCSKHFLDEYPTRESDPLPAHVSPSEVIQRRVFNRTAHVVLTPLASPTAPEKTTDSASVDEIIPDKHVETIQPMDQTNPQERGLLAITIKVTNLATSRNGLKQHQPQKPADKFGPIKVPSQEQATVPEKIMDSTSVKKVIPAEHVETVQPMDQTNPQERRLLAVAKVTSLATSNNCPKEHEPQKFADKFTQTCDADVGQVKVPSQEQATKIASVKMKSGWACFAKENHASFVKYDENTHSCLIELRVHHTVPEIFCQTFVLGQSLPPESDLVVEQRKIRTYQDIQDFMLLLEKVDICKGISKLRVEQFHQINDTANGKFCYRTNTVRAMKCKLLSRGAKCVECLKYQQRLKSNSRKRKKPITRLKMSNNRFLSREQLVEKMKLMSEDNHSLRAKVRKLNIKLEKLDNGEHREMVKYFAKAKDDIDCGKPFGIFLAEQLKVGKRKSCCGHKWNPEIVKWCLNIYNKSPTAYKSLQSAGYIMLPSTRTMRIFKNLVKQTPGYFDHIPEPNPVHPVQSDECGKEDANVSSEHILIEVDVLSDELVRVRSESMEVVSSVDHNIVCQNIEEIIPQNL